MTTEMGDAVRLYLRDLAKVQMLSAAEEIRLGKRIQMMLREQKNDAPDARVVRDGQRAMDQLAESNTRLVVSIAKRIAHQVNTRGIPLEDLIGEGNLGLMRALVKFDPEKGFRFSTYATWWIEQAVRRAIAEQGYSPRVPPHIMDEAARVKRQLRVLAQDLGRDPTLDEAADLLGLDRKALSDLMAHGQPTASLDAPLPGDTEIRLGDTIADTSKDMGEAIEEAERREVIAEVMRVLPARTRRVLQYRLGLYDAPDAKEHTLDETALEMNRTRELTRQIEDEGLKWMKGRKSQLRPHLAA